MNYAVDNTIDSPASLVGVTTGDTYIVPPVGAFGEWADQGDKLAIWGGVSWNFTDPAEGSEYQIVSGPNAGRIYVRTGVVAGSTQLIPNYTFLEDPADYTEFVLSDAGTDGLAEWITGGGNSFIDLSAYDTGEHASLLITFPTVAGTYYDLTYGRSNFNGNGTSGLVTATVKDVTTTATLADLDTSELSSGVTPLQFLATGDDTSIEFRASSTGTDATIRIDYISVLRRAQQVLNGDFDDSFTSWTAPSPWAIDSGYPSPMSASVAAAVIDYPGHVPTPSLRQTVEGLTSGEQYRLDLDILGGFTYGKATVYIDGTPIADIGESGHHNLYFRASATSHVLEFALTKYGATTFEVQIDNISVMSALWSAHPSLSSVMAGDGDMELDNAVGKQGGGLMAGAGSLVLTSRRDRPGSSSMPGVSLMSSGSQRGTSVVVQNILMPGQGGLAMRTGAEKWSGTILAPGVGGMELSMQSHGHFLVRDAVASIMSLWAGKGCCAGNCDTPMHTEALEKLNAAMQKLHSSNKEWGFVSNVPMTISPVGGSGDTIVLPSNVTSVKRVVFRPALNSGETTFGTFPLRPLRTRHELEAFSISRGRDLWPLSSAESSLTQYAIPMGYFTEAEDEQTGVPDRPPSLRIMVAPAFTGPRAWKVDVQCGVSPPRYTCEHVRSGIALAVPHRHAETLLLPLARYYALSSRYFTKPELQAAVEEQARDVLNLLGDLQPASPEASKEPKAKGDRR